MMCAMYMSRYKQCVFLLTVHFSSGWTLTVQLPHILVTGEYHEGMGHK